MNNELKKYYCPNCNRSGDEWEHEDTLDDYVTLSEGRIGELRIYSCPCGASVSLLVFANIVPSFDIDINHWDMPE